MGLFSFIKNNKSDEQHFIALDIGSNNVRALIIRVDENKERGYVIGYGKECLPFANITQRQILNINSVVEKTGNAISQAVNLAGIKPNKVIVGIGGPKLICNINQASHVRKKPDKKIDHPELQNIFTQIQQQSKDKLIKQLKNNKSKHKVELINAAIISILIDGDLVENPINFTGRELDFNFYASYAPLFQIGALQSVIDELKLDLVSIVNEPYALSKSFDLKQYQYRDSLLIDVGGDTTNITCIQNGMLEFTSCFDVGCRIFTKRLAREIDITLEKADQYLIDYSDDLLADETAKEFNKLFLDEARKWHNELAKDILSRKIDDCPRKIYLAGGGAMIPEIEQIITNNKTDKISFVNQPSLKTIHPVDIESIVDKTTQVTGPQDVNILSLANIGLKFIDSEGPASQFVKRIMQTIRT